MTIEELGDKVPKWLRDAKTENADVIIKDGQVIWCGGLWCGGAWWGGTWCGGEWRGGAWWS
jgi:hypothetical protein